MLMTKKLRSSCLYSICNLNITDDNNVTVQANLSNVSISNPEINDFDLSVSEIKSFLRMTYCRLTKKIIKEKDYDIAFKRLENFCNYYVLLFETGLDIDIQNIKPATTAKLKRILKYLNDIKPYYGKFDEDNSINFFIETFKGYLV